jgi:hypothetical protein
MAFFSEFCVFGVAVALGRKKTGEIISSRFPEMLDCSSPVSPGRNTHTEPRDK